MNYRDRLNLMAELDQRRRYFQREIQLLDLAIAELARVDDLECENAWLNDMQRKSFMKSLEATPTAEEKKLPEKTELPNRGHWVWRNKGPEKIG